MNSTEDVLIRQPGLGLSQAGARHLIVRRYVITNSSAFPHAHRFPFQYSHGDVSRATTPHQSGFMTRGFVVSNVLVLPYELASSRELFEELVVESLKFFQSTLLPVG